MTFCLLELNYINSLEYLLANLIKRLIYINYDYKTCYAIMQVMIGRIEGKFEGYYVNMGLGPPYGREYIE